MEIQRIIQFLVCPQRDFIDKISCDQKLPNRLHIGYEGALKLRGDESRGEPDFFVDTALKFYNPNITGSGKSFVVIDEDWHPRSCLEFSIFGEHCIKGTDGSKLAGQLEEKRWHRQTFILRANSINVSSDKNYSKIIEEVCGDVSGDKIRVGVFGVWTSIKVEYLLINLRTLPPYFRNIAVCEPLCANPIPQHHTQAIEKFKMMGYTVFDNINEYCRWMGLEG